MRKLPMMQRGQRCILQSWPILNRDPKKAATMTSEFSGVTGLLRRLLFTILVEGGALGHVEIRITTWQLPRRRAHIIQLI